MTCVLVGVPLEGWFVAKVLTTSYIIIFCNKDFLD